MTNPESFKSLQKWLQEIERYSKEDVIVAVAVTKCDLIDKRQVDELELSDYLTSLKIPYRLVSAKNAEGVEALFDLIDRKYLSKSVNDFEYAQDNPADSQASIDEMNELIGLIESRCSNFGYWKTKVRTGFGTPVSNDTKIPQGISQMLIMSQNSKGKKADLLKHIGELADYKHSTGFQWLHSLFRGRDNETNQFYGILAPLKDGAKQSVVKKIITELKNQSHVLDDNVSQVKQPYVEF